MDSLAQSRCRLMAEDRGSGGSRTASGACGVEQVSSLSGWCFATLTEAARARLLLETIREDLPSPQRRLTDRFTHEETKLWSFQTEIMV